MKIIQYPLLTQKKAWPRLPCGSFPSHGQSPVGLLRNIFHPPERRGENASCWFSESIPPNDQPTNNYTYSWLRFKFLLGTITAHQYPLQESLLTNLQDGFLR